MCYKCIIGGYRCVISVLQVRYKYVISGYKCFMSGYKCVISML